MVKKQQPFSQRSIEVFDITNPPLANKFGQSPATSLNRGSTVAKLLHVTKNKGVVN